MKTTGIIAEYNPFHNGHAYQIENIRRQTGADNIVIVMSGNFVQRGTPAFTDKYLRTAMALENGADFVFELPAIYATASAGLFALGGTALLESLGFIDNICFGSECGDINILNKAASMLTSNNKFPDPVINKIIKSGVSYPAAQSMAIKQHFPDCAEEIKHVLRQPNNILAIEYLKALKLLKSKITPFTIKRCDNGYNNTDYTNCTDNFSSASAIRNAFASEKEPLKAISSFIPGNIFKILSQNTERININEDMFSNILYYKLRSIINKNNIPVTLSTLTEFLDVSDALACRIVKHIEKYNTFTGFATTLKTKQYTYSRICRALLHIMLDIRTDSFNITLPLSSHSHLNSCQITPYARLLGMDKAKSSILKNITNTILVTKTADTIKCIKKNTLYSSSLINFAEKTFEKDIFAADLYRNIKYNNNTCPDEYRAGIIIK